MRAKAAGIFGTVRRFLVGEVRHPIASWTAFLRPRSVTREQMTEQVGDGLDSSSLMAPILWVARTFPLAPPALDRTVGDDTDPVHAHELLELLRRPNQFYDGSTLWWATMLSFCLSGNSYWLKVRGRSMEVEELWWIPPSSIRPCWPADGSEFISCYEYETNGERSVLLPEDVVHLRHGIDPRNPRLGLAPIAPALSEVFTDDEAARFVATILGNAGVPGMVISPASDDALIDDIDEVKREVESRTTGEHRGRPLVMKARTDVKPFGFSPSDIDLTAVRNISEERICALLGIPAAVVGFGTGLEQTKVGATMKEMRAEAWHGGLIPYQRMISGQIEHQLLAEFEADTAPWAFRFDHSEVPALQEDENARFERMGRAVSSGVIRRDEGREALGYEGGEALWYVPIGVFPMPDGQAAMPPRAAAAADDDEKGLRRKDALAESAAERFPRRPPDEGQLQFMARLDRFRAERSMEMAEAVRSILDRGAARAEIVAREMLDEPKWAPVAEKGVGGLERKDELAVLRESFADELMSRVGEFEEERVDLRSAFETTYAATLADVTVTLATVYAIELDVPDPVSREVLEQGGRRAGLVDLSETAKQRVFDVLVAGREAGDNPIAIARRLRGTITAGRWSTTAQRALVIARTESLHAQRVSTVATYREAENVTAVMVFDDRIGHHDSDCMARAGRVITFEESQAMMAEEHPNGTLSFAPVVERRTNGGAA